MNKNTGNLYRNTSLRNGGRRAGAGIDQDDYGEESMGGGVRYGAVKVRFPLDGVKPEELNGECVIVQKGKANNE